MAETHERSPLKQALIRQMLETIEAEMAQGEVSKARRDELVRVRDVLRFLPARAFANDDWIAPSSLVELEVNQRRTRCFLLPSALAWFLEFEGQPTQIIGTRSVLGEALLGKKVGDEVRIGDGARERVYRVLSHC